MLRELRLAIVGAGALGSEVCRLLAENSFTNVLVIDPDQLEARNVQLSSLHQDIFSDLGSEAFHHFKSKLIVDAIQKRYALAWDSLPM